MQGEMGDGGVVRNATRQPAPLQPARHGPPGRRARCGSRWRKAVTQAVGACDVELSNYVWRRPPRAHGMGVCSCIAGRLARSAGSSTRPQMLGRGNGRRRVGVGVVCTVLHLAEPGRWVTLSTRPSRHVVVCSNAVCTCAAAYASIASPQRVWKWKGEGIMGTHGQERPHARRDTPCQGVQPYNCTVYGLLLYGSSAIQTPVTLLFQYSCGITFFDAAECQAASTAYDTLVDSISEHIL